MPELLLELFSEEIPARMQARAAEDLKRLLGERLAPLLEGESRAFAGPRRLALAATLRPEIATEGREERGPRIGAPEAALEGFCRKHGAARSDLSQQNGFWVLVRAGETIAAADLVARAVPAVVRGFPWPTSMRWGRSDLLWVRPLQRLLCLLDGAPVALDLRQGEDLAHGLVAGAETEGHRVMAPGAFAVRGFADYQAGLRDRRVILDAAERMALIRDGIARLAAAEGLEVVPDEGLLAEVAGLVEWPVPLLGRIDDAFMDLPPELMRTTMRVNQRYFALRRPDGSAAPRFALVANIEAVDGGRAIVAGNERVLRARLSDARFFWDQDRKHRLEEFLPKLESVVFHAKLGTQGERVRRLERLAGLIAERIGADAAQARRAAHLAKADLASGMVGEFPELQGVMGRYYALAQGEPPEVAEAIGSQYRPLGPGDAVPAEPVAIAVALADKLDQLAGFFAVGEKPTGSGDPFALRRAALGVIRIVRENGLRVGLRGVLGEALRPFPGQHGAVAAELLDFLAERLRVQLRTQGARHDLVAAVFGAAADDDLNRLLARADAVRAFLESDAGANLLAGYKRAANILRIEEKRDGQGYDTGYERHLLKAPEEQALAAALEDAAARLALDLEAEDFGRAMEVLAGLRTPVDAFFDRVTVNDPAPELRRNRLRLLARLRAAMDTVADFSKIES